MKCHSDSEELRRMHSTSCAASRASTTVCGGEPLGDKVWINVANCTCSATEFKDFTFMHDIVDSCHHTSDGQRTAVRTVLNDILEHRKMRRYVFTVTLERRRSKKKKNNADEAKQEANSGSPVLKPICRRSWEMTFGMTV